MKRTLRASMAQLVKLYAGREFRERGDRFATLPELKAICCDPLGWLELVRGEDAYELIQLALKHD